MHPLALHAADAADDDELLRYYSSHARSSTAAAAMARVAKVPLEVAVRLEQV